LIKKVKNENILVGLQNGYILIINVNTGQTSNTIEYEQGELGYLLMLSNNKLISRGVNSLKLWDPLPLLQY
jgi:hypothetical protein